MHSTGRKIMHLQGVMQLWVLLVMVLVCSPVVALQGRPLATHRSRLANAARPLTMMSTSPSSFDHAKTTTLTTKSSLLWKSYVQRLGTVAVTSLLLSWSPSSSLAVSGGGKDFATKDIRGQVFDGQNLNNKDFTQCDGTGATFKGSKLRGSRFYRANLKDADFSSADLSSASLEDTSLKDVNFKNAILEGAYFSSSIIEAKDLTGADFTDALMPDLTKDSLCKRSDVAGSSTADSLMCP